MLFRTVYGPELKVIYQFIRSSTEPLTRLQIMTTFVPKSNHDELSVSSQNVEDALSFLVSSYLLEEQKGVYIALNSGLPFHLALLHNLRDIESGVLAPKHPLDTQFSALLGDLFILPDVLYADNLHALANSLDAIKRLGGISKEKIQAWKRVMEYLGLGYRLNRGFVCVAAPDVLRGIIALMTEDQATLQAFFEQNVTHFLPCVNRLGDVSQGVRQPMLYLAQSGYIKLTPLQDSPVRAYFHPHNLRQIIREHVDVVA